MAEHTSRWSSSFYTPSAAAKAPIESRLQREPDDIAHWQEYLASGAARLDVLRDCFMRVSTWPESVRIDVALGTLDASGFSPKGALERNREIFDQLARPWLAWAFDEGLDDLGLHLEGRIYTHYVKAHETEAHARATYEALVAPIVRGASRRRRGAAAAPCARAEPPRIGYFLHAPSTLAHAETLFNVFAALRRQPSPTFEPVVYVYDGEDAAFDARMRELAVPVVYLARSRGGADPHSVRARFDVLAARLREDGACTLVWMSALPWLAYVATAGIGVPLVWYSLKYHVLRLPGIDRYVTNGDGDVREIQGNPWQTIRLSGRWFDAASTQAARAARAQLPAHRCTLGTLGREEKMLEPAFVESVARILREHPDAFYVWSGRAQPPEVLEAFSRHGVLERQRFLGWTNTRVASQMIDVYLDTFPAPGGFTVREAMAAGAATVFFRSTEAEETGPNGFMRRLLAGEGAERDVRTAREILGVDDDLLLLLSRTPEEYMAHAGRLIEDETLRCRVGEANRAFVHAFYEDDDRMLASHLEAVLPRECASR